MIDPLYIALGILVYGVTMSILVALIANHDNKLLNEYQPDSGPIPNVKPPESGSGATRTSNGGRVMNFVDKDLLMSTITYIRDVYIKSNLTDLAAKALLIAWGRSDEVDRLINNSKNKTKLDIENE
jgi:hypothetical protein